MTNIPRQITDRELPTVLAALRYFQANRDDALPLFEECDYFEAHPPLDESEIDGLCEELNCSTDDSIPPENLQQAAVQLHEATTGLLLDLLDANDDCHPETGLMYRACAHAWLAVDTFRKATGSFDGGVSADIYSRATEAVKADS